MSVGNEKGTTDQKHEYVARAHVGQQENASNECNLESNPEKARVNEWATAVLRCLNFCLGKVVKFLKSIDGWMTAIATIAIAIVAFLQWWTSEKTDKTLRDTLVSNQAVQRAFVVVNELRQDPIRDQSANIVALRFTPVIKNSGITPARTMSFIALNPHNDSIFLKPSPGKARNLAFLLNAPSDPDEILFDRPRNAENYITSNVVLGPQSIISPPISGNESMTVEDLLHTQIGSPQLSRFFYGSIRYFDIFNNQHISKYCFSG
jgi:hypothetical protein